MKRTRYAALVLAALAACQDAGTNPFAPADARLDGSAGAPSPPAGVVATAVGPWQIDVAWTDASTTETSFQVYRRIRYADGTFTPWAEVAVTGAGATTFQSTGLAPNTRYQHQVRACATVCSAWGVGNIATTHDGPPTPPRDLTAEVLSWSAVRLRWTDASTTETGFQLSRRARLGDGSWTEWAVVGTVAANTVRFDDGGLSENTAYQYQVAACDPTRCSPPAESPVAATPLAPGTPPANLVATPVAPARIDLTWTAGTRLSHYRLYRRIRNADGSFTAWEQAALPDSAATAFTDTGLLGSTRYQYQIAACSPAGCGAWVVAAIVTTPASGVAAPTGLTASAASPTQVNLSWTDASGNETGFVLQRRTRTSTTAATYTAWEQVAAPAANATGHADTGVTPGATYQYRIRACNGDDCSAWTAGGDVTAPGAPPAAPYGFTGTVVSGNQVDLSWTDASAIETRFELQRRIIRTSTQGPWGTLATPAANATLHHDTSVLPDSTYWYQIRACNDVGCSAWVQGHYITPAYPPNAPTSVAGEATAWDRITLTWKDASTNETGYQIWSRTVNPDGSYGAWALARTHPSYYREAAGGTVTASVEKLTNGSTYQFLVFACNAGGCTASAPSAPIIVTPPPAAPANLVGTRISSTQIDLTWTDQSSNETFFQLQRRARNGDGTYTGFTVVATPGANATSYSNTGLAAGTAYQYQVRACNKLWCSTFALGALVGP